MCPRRSILFHFHSAFFYALENVFRGSTFKHILNENKKKIKQQFGTAS